MSPSLANRYRVGSARSILLYVLAGLGVVCVLGCLACGGVFWVGLNSEEAHLKELVNEQFADHAELQKHIGKIESFEMNMTKTAETRADTDGRKVLVFDIAGPKGKGELVIEQIPDTGQIKLVAVITEDGETITFK